MKRLTALFKAMVAITLAGVMAGCTTSKNYSSSVVQFLYPEKNELAPVEAFPALVIPLKVGIAFVPANQPVKQKLPPNVYIPNTHALTEKEKMVLMRKVGEFFQKQAFVSRVELIPSSYLRPKGSFTNLDQVRTMFGVDLVVLLSYDQSQFVNEGFSTITYWTIIGAYMVKGEKNDTHTMLDAAVFHIRSRKLLFRAPGISHVKSKATPINLSEQARIDSLEGYNLASDELVRKLAVELDTFRKKLNR